MFVSGYPTDPNFYMPTLIYVSEQAYFLLVSEQTADHITSGRCPIYRPPEGINGLIVLDDETRAWLENNALDIWVVRDGTRKKKKIKKCDNN